MYLFPCDFRMSVACLLSHVSALCLPQDRLLWCQHAYSASLLKGGTFDNQHLLLAISKSVLSNLTACVASSEAFAEQVCAAFGLCQQMLGALLRSRLHHIITNTESDAKATCGKRHSHLRHG